MGIVAVTRSFLLVGKPLAACALISSCLLLPLTAGADTVSAILGADINKLVVKTIADLGMESAPRVGASRKFTDCAKTLTVDQMFGGWKTVKVSCPDKNGWSLIVRTYAKTSVKTSTSGVQQPHKAKVVPAKNGVAKTAVNTPTSTGQKSPKKSPEVITVLALGRSMSRGDVITPQDVIQVSVLENGFSGVFYDSQDIIGRKLKSIVTAKKPIQARHLLPQWLVEEDDEVIIQNHAGGISVDMLGLALENGQFGEWIKVQNMSSGIVVIGQIKNKKLISTNAKISSPRVVN